MKRIWRRFLRWWRYPEWSVVRTTWPFPEGWGVYRERDKTLMDTFAKKSRAQEEADRMSRIARYCDITVER